MASILFISKNGDGIPIAIRLANEGHVVRVYIHDQKAQTSLEGFKNPIRISSYKKFIDSSDLIIFDMVKLGRIAEEIKSKNDNVLGGGTFNDKLELDREYGFEVVSKLTNLIIPEYERINSASDAIKYIRSTKHPCVIKPLGNKPTSLTLVSKDDSNEYLLSMISKHGDSIFPAVIQKRIDGIEISTEGWFNGSQFVYPFNHTMEKKRFMTGNLGPNTGCMGNIVWLTDGSDKIVQDGLLPLTPLLQRIGYIGPIDINCIVNKDGPHFLEFTARFGYDAIQTLLELVRGSVFNFLYSICSSNKTIYKFRNEFAIGVRLSMPPYPHSENCSSLQGMHVVNVPKEAQNHIWLSDVAKAGDKFVMAGVDGVIGCVTARGVTIRECVRRVYRTIKNISISPDIQYRMDIADDVPESINSLIEMGMISPPLNQADEGQENDI